MELPHDDTGMMQTFLQQEFDRLVEDNWGDFEQWGYEGKGRNRVLIKRWFFTRDLEKSLAHQMLTRIRQSVRTRHKLRVRWGILLRNIEDDQEEFYYTNTPASPWLNKLSESRDWLEVLEESRLQGQVKRPNTKWVFERAVSVDLKAVLDRQPLQIGRGCLPAWLRNKRGVVSLDQYEGCLCLFRCLAVHDGSRPDRCARRTRQLARSFFADHPNFRPPPPLPRGDRFEQPPLGVDKLDLFETHFKQGIATYTVTPARDFVLAHAPAHYDQLGRPTMTIGIYEEHAFLITDINKVTQNFTCGDCGARLTQAGNLSRHSKTCSRGQTQFDCPGNQITAPELAFEKAFYPNGSFGIKATCWIEHEAKQRGIHIHHQKCGHGGKRTIMGYKVDGYHPKSKAIFEYDGCNWHGCPDCYTSFEERAEVVGKPRKGREITREEAYQNALLKVACLQSNGYTVIERWEHEIPNPWWNDRCPPKGNETYPHAIVYDFESYQDKSKASQPTRYLSYENEHVPISVSIADTLNPEPEYIVSRDPNELLQLFYHALEWRSEAIREDIAQKYRPPDVEGLSELQKSLIDQWCDQVPVVGFNSGHYDMKLIQKYFLTQLAQENAIVAADKEGCVMFLKTPRYKFLDIMNYMAPGTTYDKWVKTYGAKQVKSWLPYEWFDSPVKLDYPGLSPYLCWYSQLKNFFRANSRGVRGLPACVSRERHADLWRLARVLQQPGRVPLSRGLGEDARLPHGPGS